MLKTHHQIIALTTTTAIAISLNASPIELISMSVVSLMTVNLADIDRKVPMLRHRGITHSLLTWAFLSWLLIYFIPNSYYLLTITASLSYLSHIIMDSLSIAGVRLLYPLTRNRNDNQYGIYIGTNPKTNQVIHHHFHYLGYRVGGRIETLITTIAILIECGLLVAYFQA